MEVEQEDGLLVLTDATFEEAKTRFPTLLVHFHAPLCTICNNVTLNLHRISEEYRSTHPAFRIGQLDAIANPDTGKRMHVVGFPTLMLLERNETVQYRGPLTEVSVWLKQRLRPTHWLFNTSEDLTDFVQSYSFSTLLFADQDSEQALILSAVSKEHPELPIAIITTTALNTLWHTTFPSLIVNNILDNIRFTYTGQWTNSEICTFITLKSVRVKLPWGEAASDYLFAKQHPALLFFRSDATAMTFDKTLAPVWRLGRIPFVEMDFTVYSHQVLMEFLGTERYKYPNIMIVHVKEGEILKYAMKEEITVAGVTAFLDAWEQGLLPRFLKSESPPRPFPTHSPGVILELTGQHYPEAISKPNLHALIWVYSQGCPNERAFQEVGEKFSKRNEVLVGRINGAKNDLQGLALKSFPQMVVYQAGTKQPQVYKGNFITAEMIAFVEAVVIGGKGRS